MRLVSCLVVVLAALATADIHRTNQLMDEIIAGLRPNFPGSILMDDFSFTTCGVTVSCRAGNGSSPATIERSGLSRIKKTSRYPVSEWDLTSTLTIRDFNFFYDDCTLRFYSNVTHFSMLSKNLWNSLNVKMSIVESQNCTGTFETLQVDSIRFELEPNQAFDTLIFTQEFDNFKELLLKSVIDSLNINLFQVLGVEFSSLKNCY
uniref:Uncharacterized protein n=1 Tax=Riptortus pedestris TaxID=329032 RepID=R4WHY5_RIPPE|nr:unknown secreted protein [Riptortus pedestris]